MGGPLPRPSNSCTTRSASRPGGRSAADGYAVPARVRIEFTERSKAERTVLAAPEGMATRLISWAPEPKGADALRCE